jgi:hypothetical protein
MGTLQVQSDTQNHTVKWVHTLTQIRFYHYVVPVLILRDRKKGVGKIAIRYMRASLSQLWTVSRNAPKVLFLSTCHKNEPLSLQ